MRESTAKRRDAYYLSSSILLLLVLYYYGCLYYSVFRLRLFSFVFFVGSKKVAHYYYFFSNRPTCVSVVHMNKGFSTVITLVSSASIFLNCFGGLNIRACEMES